MSREIAEKLVRHIAKNMERESALLEPYPATIMHNPYGLLNIIHDEFGLTSADIDGWLVDERVKEGLQKADTE